MEASKFLSSAIYMDSVLYIKSKMIVRIFLIVHGSFEECFYRDVRNVGHRRKREFTLSQEILLHRLRGQTFSVSRLGNFITVVPSILKVITVVL